MILTERLFRGVRRVTLFKYEWSLRRRGGRHFDLSLYVLTKSTARTQECRAHLADRTEERSFEVIDAGEPSETPDISSHLRNVRQLTWIIVVTEQAHID
jgi:hypothetical protein